MTQKIMTKADYDQAQDLDELFVLLNADAERDDSALTELPTFGGDEPADTMSIWSWDETRLIVGEGEFEIINRSDWK